MHMRTSTAYAGRSVGASIGADIGRKGESRASVCLSLSFLCTGLASLLPTTEYHGVHVYVQTTRKYYRSKHFGFFFSSSFGHTLRPCSPHTSAPARCARGSRILQIYVALRLHRPMYNTLVTAILSAWTTNRMTPPYAAYRDGPLAVAVLSMRLSENAHCTCRSWLSHSRAFFFRPIVNSLHLPPAHAVRSCQTARAVQHWASTLSFRGIQASCLTGMSLKAVSLFDTWLVLLLFS